MPAEHRSSLQRILHCLPAGGTGLLLLMLSGTVSSCAYFNTFYNAQRSFREAELLLDEAEDPAKPSKPLTDNLAKSAVRCRTVLAKYPDSRFADNALRLLGKTLFYQRDFRGAREVFRQVAAEQGTSFAQEALLWLAKCDIAEKIPPAPAQQILPLLEPGESGRRPGREFTSQIHAAAGGAYALRDQHDSSAYHYRMAAESASRDGRRAAYYLIAGEQASLTEDHALAENLFSLAARHTATPKQLERASLEQVRMLRLQGKWDRAARTIQELLVAPQFAPIRAALSLELARLYEWQKRIPEAENRFRAITEEFPRTEEAAEAYFHLGDLALQHAGDLEEAQAHYEKSREEKRGSFYSSLATAKGEKIKAVLETKQEIEDTEVRQDTTLGTSVRAETNLLDGQGSRKSGRKSVEPSELLFSCGELFAFHLGLPDSALPYFRRVATEWPESDQAPRALYALHFLVQARGDTAASASFRRDLLARYPRSEQALQMTSESKSDTNPILLEAERLRSSDPSRSTALYSEYIRTNPDAADLSSALLACAWTYDYQLSNLDSALYYYRILEERFPQREEGRAAQAKLRALSPRIDGAGSDMRDIDD